MFEPTYNDEEARRLRRLHELAVLDSEPEPLFDSLAQLASQICGAPIALLSLIDEQRQWFKAQVGLPGVTQTPREFAFCDHAIRGDALFEITDATADPRFATNPLVTGDPKIRFYAGAPLVLADGERIGTLCVIDREVRPQLSATQAQMLASLARAAVQALEMRSTLLEKALAARSRYEEVLAQSEHHYRAIVDSQAELISLAQSDGTLVYVNPAYARRFGRSPGELEGSNLLDLVDPQDRDAVRRRIAEVLGTGRSMSAENRMVGSDGVEHWVAWTNHAQQVHGETLLQSVGRDISDRRRMESALRDSQSLLLRTGRVAGVGGWQLDLETHAITWSEQTRLIHEVGPDYVPVLAGAMDFYAPEARPAIEKAVNDALNGGRRSWDLELQFITATKRHIWVRTQGEAEFENGVPVRLVGAFQDITERKRLEEALRSLNEIFERTTDFIVQTDAQGGISYMNPAARRLVGLAADAPLAGHNVAEFNTAVTQQRLVSEVLPVAHAQGVWVGDTVVLAEGGREVPISHMVIAHRDASDTVVRYSAVMRDISAVLQARRDTQRQTDILRSVTEAIPNTVVVVGSDGRYRFANGAFERAVGRPRAEIIGRSAAEVLGEAEVARRRPYMLKAFAGETVHFTLEQQGPDGVRHLALSCIPVPAGPGRFDGFVGISQDITKQRREQHRLEQLAQRDPLTGLLNRSGFEAQIEAAVQQGGGQALALLYIDLDRFKPVNDAYGHAAGDRVLQTFAQRVAALVRPTDCVARLGGDEFAVLLLGVRERANAQTVGEKVIAAAQAAIDIGDRQVEISASVGVAFGVDAAAGWRDLVARADANLYRAKADGRGRQAGATNFTPL